jgi:hypothetical protein
MPQGIHPFDVLQRKAQTEKYHSWKEVTSQLLEYLTGCLFPLPG